MIVCISRSKYFTASTYFNAPPRIKTQDRKMALDNFVRLISGLAARKPMSLYQVARRHNWNRDDVEKLLRCERRPTEKMLKDIAKEFDCDLRTLRDSLES